MTAMVVIEMIDSDDGVFNDPFDAGCKFERVESDDGDSGDRDDI